MLFFLNQLFQQKQGFHQPFVVAKINLHKGERLTFENTKVVFLDLGKADIHYVTHQEFEQFENMYLTDAVYENSPILKTSATLSPDIQTQIPFGKRLFLLDASADPILPFLHSGDRVDVMAHIDMPHLGLVTETVLEAAQVVSVGEPNHDTSNSSQYLSFYLTPDEIKILTFMKPYAEFSIVLRNVSDTNPETHQPVTLNRFLQNEKIRKIIELDSFKIINGSKIHRKSQ